MSQLSNSKPNQARSRDADSFFLPDLCTAPSVLVLIILAELLSLVITSLQFGLWPVNWEHFSLVSLFCLLAFLTSAAALCTVRRFLVSLPVVVAGSACYVTVLVIVAFYSLSSQWLLHITGGDVAFSIQRLSLHLFLGAVVTGVGLRYLYLNWQLRLRENSEAQSRIQALQSRIQPHFLFNTLNTIASLIVDSPREAEEAVEDLAALFRANLQDSRIICDWRSERDVCERYLRIETMRLGDRLRVKWRDDDMPAATPILSLSLQPLLENAVLHGVARIPEGGCITIHASTNGGECTVSVENPLPGASVPGEGNRLAWENLKRRLDHLYGDKGRLTVEEQESSFRVEMRFPLVTQA